MKRLLVSLTLVIGMFFGSTALAEPTDGIDAWEYSVTGYFANWTTKTGTTGTIAGAGDTQNFKDKDGKDVTAYSALNWGNLGQNGDHSGISITPSTSGELMYTNNGFANAVTLTHMNQTLAAGSRSLSSMDVYLELFLKDPDSDFTKTFITTLNVQFYETVNRYDEGDEKNNDIFVILNMGDTFEEFDHDGVHYVVSFADMWNVSQGVNLFTALPDWAQTYVTSDTQDGITRLPGGNTYYGFITEEWATTNITTKVRIDSPHAPTPEPGTLLLMGIGLAGLGVIARRRRQ